MSTVLILADFVGTKATKTNAELATAGARIGEVTAVVLAPVGQGSTYAAAINRGPITKIIIVEFMREDMWLLTPCNTVYRGQVLRYAEYMYCEFYCLVWVRL